MTDTYEKAYTAKSAVILGLLLQMAEGPAEAYAILIATIYRLNFELVEHPASLDDLVLEVSQSLRSVTKVQVTQ